MQIPTLTLILADRLTRITENLPSDKITPEALGPIAKDITNAIHEVTDQIQLFIDQNVDLDILLADKPGGSQRLRLAEIGVTVAGLVSVSLLPLACSFLSRRFLMTADHR